MLHLLRMKRELYECSRLLTPAWLHSGIPPELPGPDVGSARLYTLPTTLPALQRIVLYTLHCRLILCRSAHHPFCSAAPCTLYSTLYTHTLPTTHHAAALLFFVLYSVYLSSVQHPPCSAPLYTALYFILTLCSTPPCSALLCTLYFNSALYTHLQQIVYSASQRLILWVPAQHQCSTV